MTVSIVVPVYNGGKTVRHLVDQLTGVLGPDLLQIVLVNDGSPDDSDGVCRSLRSCYPGTVTYVKLAKNFGEHNAVMAGLHFARGDHVVIMDDDLQNPPEEVSRLVDHARAGGYDVVYTSYARKHHHWFRNLGSGLNDRMANFLLDKPHGLYLSSFKCLSRFAVGEVLKYNGPYPYIDGLVLRCTRNIGTVQALHRPRGEGRSNYTLRKLIRLWLNVFVNFSVMPLRVCTVAGLGFSTVGFLMGVLVFIEKLTHPDLPVGWASVLVSVVLFSGVQLVMSGLIGEYLGRLFLTENQTPQFVVREALGGEGRTRPSPAPVAAARTTRGDGAGVIRHA